uniref:Uncharacterized protein n=1 Tax=Buteo japonicus TaxID=224669 RepID=A0A8C0B5C7_9AVES
MPYIVHLVPCRESQVSMLLSIFGEVVLFIFYVRIDLKVESCFAAGRTQTSLELFVPCCL